MSHADVARTASPDRPQQIDFPGFEITSADTVVDVGCGDGLVCLHAGTLGAEVIAIDIEEELIARVERAMREVPSRQFRGIVSDADPIPLDDETATAVVATEVMEHVDVPARFAAELARIGKPGARYLISVPDPASESIMKRLAPAWYWEKPLHIRVFEHGDLDEVLRSAGLVPEARYSSGFSWSLRWFLRMAIGMEHKYAPEPSHPALDALDVVLKTLAESPNGPGVMAELDRRLPKSQVVLARKPGTVPAWPSSFGGPAGLKRRVRDGRVRVGGFDLRWTVRRTGGR